MRLLHLADLHIGKQVNNFSMLEDQRHALGQVIGMLGERGVDALLLAGDIYDKSSPSEDAVALFDWFLSEVAQTKTPVLAIPGNHDSQERIAYAQRLLAKQGVHFAPVFNGSVAKVELSDEHGEVDFWLLPYLRPIDARRAFPEAEIGSSYTAAVKAVLDACEVDADVRNVLLAHQFVTSGSAGPERADDEISLGGVDNVDVSAFAAFDYVALGHVHRPQRIGRDTARYAGSLLKYSFSEVNYDKSAVLVELGEKPQGSEPGDCVSYQLLPIVPLHDMREIRGPLEDLLEPEVVEAADAEDYIHAILTDETPHIDAMAKLRNSYPNLMALDYDNSLTKAIESESVLAADPDKLDPEELFMEFFAAQAGHDLNGEQQDLARTCLQRAQAQAKGGAR